MKRKINNRTSQLILFFGALIFFAIATFFSLYEGSKLDDVSWEWPYSAIFSNWLNGEVTSADDILTIDYLVYAAKFMPLFPVIMFISALILFLQLSFWSLKRKESALNIFLIVCALGLFFISGILTASPTVGLQLFSKLFLGTGILVAAIGTTRLIKARKLLQ